MLMIGIAAMIVGVLMLMLANKAEGQTASTYKFAAILCLLVGGVIVGGELLGSMQSAESVKQLPAGSTSAPQGSFPDYEFFPPPAKPSSGVLPKGTNVSRPPLVPNSPPKAPSVAAPRRSTLTPEEASILSMIP